MPSSHQSASRSLFFGGSVLQSASPRLLVAVALLPHRSRRLLLALQRLCSQLGARPCCGFAGELFGTFFLRLQPLAVRVVSPRRTITLWAKSSRKDCELAMAEVYREYSFKIFGIISVFSFHYQQSQFIISDYMWKQQQNKRK